MNKLLTVIPKTNRTEIRTDRKLPKKSILLALISLWWTLTRVKIINNKPKGTFNKKPTRHERAEMSQPPRISPKLEPIPSVVP